MKQQPIFTGPRYRVYGAIARNLFVQAYANFMDDSEIPARAKRGLPRAGGGEHWEDAAPPTSRAAYLTAKQAVAAIEKLNGMYLDALYEKARDACRSAGFDPRRMSSGEKHKDTPEAFGSDLAMMMTGTGVSWFDDHAKFPLTLPWVEFHIMSRGEIRNGNVGEVSARLAHTY